MKALTRNVLEQLIAASAEPVVVARTDSAEWPVVLCNPAFERLAGETKLLQRPFADVVEQLLGRKRALEISDVIRTRRESSIPVEINKREFLLVLVPLGGGDKSDARFCAGYLRTGEIATATGNTGVRQALLNAKRQIRDMSREDPVTGLLNARAFRDVLDHDWEVAKRENSSLALVAFKLEDFDKYREVFGRHAADSCQRRIAGAIRRCLQRASDVAARISCSEGEHLVVLSHSSDEALVSDFANGIATSVRELGLHHPRSKVGRFISVSYEVAVREAGVGKTNAAQFLDSVLGIPSA
jgi:diguanylate cyclase (GGDEF)-like protein